MRKKCGNNNEAPLRGNANTNVRKNDTLVQKWTEKSDVLKEEKCMSSKEVRDFKVATTTQVSV